MQSSNRSLVDAPVIGMGEVHKIYKRGATLSDVMSSLPMIFFSFLAIYYVWTQVNDPSTIMGPLILIVLGIPFFMYLGIFPLIRAFSQRNDFALVCTHGFDYHHHGEVTSFRWDEITAIKAHAVRVLALGMIPAGLVREYSISKGTSELLLAGTFQQVDDLLSEIRKRTFPYLFNRLKKEFDAGSTIYFGTVTMSQSSVLLKGNIFRWTDFEEVTAADGYIHFVLKGHKRPGSIRLQMRYIENLDVLVALANDYIRQISLKGTKWI